MAALADTGKTLAELVKINDKRLSGGVADNLLEEAPVIQRLASTMASNGTDHSWLQYSTAPPGGFRILNDGVAQGQSADTLIRTPCEILDYSYFLDTRAVANYTQGDLIARENARHLRSMFTHLEQQIFAGTVANGTGSSFADAAGFEGIVDANVSRLNTLAHPMVIGAGGAGVGVQSSVYLIRSVNPLDDAALVMGSDGNIVVSPAVRQMIAGGAAGTRLSVWSIEIASYFCWQWGGSFSVSRIANVQTGGALLNDDLIAQAINLHPATRRPNLICMNRDAERQLRESRTAVNQTGAPAPFAESAFGIEIVVTDQISGDEAVVV